MLKLQLLSEDLRVKLKVLTFLILLQTELRKAVCLLDSGQSVATGKPVLSPFVPVPFQTEPCQSDRSVIAVSLHVSPLNCVCPLAAVQGPALGPEPRLQKPEHALEGGNVLDQSRSSGCPLHALFLRLWVNSVLRTAL